MNIPQKKYKIVKNINQNAGYVVPQQYVKMVEEIKIDFRDVLLIIFSNEVLFNNFKNYIVTQILKIPKLPLSKMVTDFINNIKYDTVIKQLNKDDILPKIEDLLKKLIKIYDIKNINPTDINDLIKIIIILIGFITDAGIIANLINMFFVRWIKFPPNYKINDSFNINVIYANFYPKSIEEKIEFKTLLRDFISELSNYSSNQDFIYIFFRKD
jgi:hypothetical protein